MKRFFKSFLVLALILTTVGISPADTYARHQYLRVRTITAVSSSFTSIATNSTVVGGSGGTTGNVNTLTANLIIVVLTYYTSAGANLTDNQSNTYTQLTAYSDNNMAVTIFYKISPTVSSTHTFSTTSHFAGMNVIALKSTGTPTYNSQQTGASQNSSGAITPGSITPSANNCVVIGGFGSFNGSTSGGPAYPTSFTGIGKYTTATAEAGNAWYEIQTTATARNPSVTDTGSSEAITMAVFKP